VSQLDSDKPKQFESVASNAGLLGTVGTSGWDKIRSCVRSADRDQELGLLGRAERQPRQPSQYWFECRHTHTKVAPSGRRLAKTRAILEDQLDLVRTLRPEHVRSSSKAASLLSIRSFALFVGFSNDCRLVRFVVLVIIIIIIIMIVVGISRRHRVARDESTNHVEKFSGDARGHVGSCSRTHVSARAAGRQSVCIAVRSGVPPRRGVRPLGPPSETPLDRESARAALDEIFIIRDQ
jgi:hypothetical protein